MLGHSLGYSLIRSTTVLPAVRAGWFVMDPGGTSLYYLGGIKFWEILEPEASCLGFSVSEHPGLDDLIWLAPSRGHNPNRIFNANFGNVSVSKS